MATKAKRRYSGRTDHAPGRDRKGVLVYFSAEQLVALKRCASKELRPVAAYVRLVVLRAVGLA